MKNKFLHKITVAGCFFFSFTARAQFNEPAYAVTDSIKDGVKWNCLRTLDVQTGNYSNVLLRLLGNNDFIPSSNVVPNNGVAAIAYDKKDKRLYFTPLLTDKLSYIDLRSLRTVVVTNHFTNLFPKASDQSNIITRMVIGDDDKGYALTNDGMHLIRFKTNNNMAVTDLGSLIDAPGNNEMSVHNACSSFGGDIVADQEDHLYLFTSRNHVFKINIQTRVAKYIGTVRGLPESFTTSGAAVDKSREKVILSSATDASGLYLVNLKTLFANRLTCDDTRFVSDLATAYLLKDKDRHDYKIADMITGNSGDNDHIQLYPNPVINKEFKLQFTDAPAGMFTIEVLDVSGKSIVSKLINVGGKSNIVSVELPQQIIGGIYIVRIIDHDKKSWFSGKIVVQ